MSKPWRDRLISALVWLLCAAPLLLFVWQGFNDDLTANPIEYILRALGLWGLRFLCITLALAPLAKLLKAPMILRYRRRIGLWAFAYVALHLTTYVAIDKQFDWPTIGEDIAKRPYITIGMAAFALLIPLTITSVNRIRRKMRARNWQRLHQLIYDIKALGPRHPSLRPQLLELLASIDADVVLLACTELPLIADITTGKQLVDITQLVVEAMLDHTGIHAKENGQ